MVAKGGTGKYRVLCEICGKTFEVRAPRDPLPDHGRPDVPRHICIGSKGIGVVLEEIPCRK